MNLSPIHTTSSSMQANSLTVRGPVDREPGICGPTSCAALHLKATGVALLALKTKETPEPIVRAVSPKIQYPCPSSIWFTSVPDIGMDRFLVTDGSPIGTRGVGPCFVLCMIGQTVMNSPVLGLCHKSSVTDFVEVHDRLIDEMVCQEDAVSTTIATYVIGGEASSKETEPVGGSLEEEETIKALAPVLYIKGVLFNQTSGENDADSLAVVLTPENIFVSKRALFPCKEDPDPLAPGDGISLFELDEDESDDEEGGI